MGLGAADRVTQQRRRVLGWYCRQSQNSLCPLQIRTELEMQMACNLREFKEFIDNEMIVILGQMDSPTQIFDHVFLVSDSSHTPGGKLPLEASFAAAVSFL